MAKASTLTDEGKKHLTSAVPHYVKGVAETAGLAVEFQQWGSSTASAAPSLLSNPMKLMSFKDEIAAPAYVASNLPKLISNFMETTGNFVKFTQKNDLEVPRDLSKVAGF